VERSLITITDGKTFKVKHTLNYHGVMRLPDTMDFTLWGKNMKIKSKNLIIIEKFKQVDSTSLSTYLIQVFEGYNIIKSKINNDIIVTFKDTIDDINDKSTFQRVIYNKKNEITQEIKYERGKIILSKFHRKTKFINKINQDKIRSLNFITMDLETRTIDGIMIPYCISIFDGKTCTSFYLSDYSSSQEMLEQSVKFLMKKEFNRYRIFLHNFSNFDGIFLIRILSGLATKLKPIIRETKVIDLKFYFGETGKNILYFRDSFLLLPSSLDDLAKAFNVGSKGIFPYKFVNNEDIPADALNYKGQIPDFKYFDGISRDEYNNYCKDYYCSPWDLRKETTLYCELDVKILYQIIEKFSEEIFELFQINIMKYPTLPSLAFAIYRSKFLSNKTKIPIFTGNMFEFMKDGYTGGHVDVYKPYGKNVGVYDVNSLYPNEMKNSFMPSGNPIYFEGDILTYLENRPFGIFEVEVEAPKDLNVPILQVKLKTENGGVRTISPLGKFI
jgi:hypothetical protein